MPMRWSERSQHLRGATSISSCGPRGRRPIGFAASGSAEPGPGPRLTRQTEIQTTGIVPSLLASIRRNIRERWSDSPLRPVACKPDRPSTPLFACEQPAAIPLRSLLACVAVGCKRGRTRLSTRALRAREQLASVVGAGRGRAKDFCSRALPQGQAARSRRSRASVSGVPSVEAAKVGKRLQCRPQTLH